MKEAIANTLKGDYESVILAGAGAVTSKAGEMAQAFGKALKERMKNNGQGDVQHHRDSHGQGQGQNSGREAELRRRAERSKRAPAKQSRNM